MKANSVSISLVDGINVSSLDIISKHIKLDDKFIKSLIYGRSVAKDLSEYFETSLCRTTIPTTDMKIARSVYSINNDKV